MKKGRIVIITGAPGTGKTTTASMTAKESSLEKSVHKLLEYYGYPESHEAAKKWYDGYRFGTADIYCPWDVLNYCDSLLDDKEAQPENYWINTSSNDAVKRFIQGSEMVFYWEYWG